MAFDGSGVFLRLRSWIADATAGVKIRADFHDDEDNNFASGLSQCIVKDGQTTITQNIPWNSKRITALADPVDPQDAATKDYADTKMPLDGSAPVTGDITIQSADLKNSIFGDKGGKHRWEIVLGNATAEGGSDVGSDFELINYHDDGTLIGDVFFGNRASGLMTVKGDPKVALGIATKQYVDGHGIIVDGSGFGAQGFPSSVGVVIAYYHVVTSLLQTSTWDGFNLTVGAGEDGIWAVYASVHIAALPADSNYQLMAIAINGALTLMASQGLMSATTSSAPSVAGHIKLAVGDKVQAMYYQQSTGGVSVTSVPGSAVRFSAFLVARV